jgi:hypothetical protein
MAPAGHIGRGRSLVNPDYHEFAPRIGFAYQPAPKIVLRGGFGFFYGGQENVGLGENLFNNPLSSLAVLIIPSRTSVTTRRLPVWCVPPMARRSKVGLARQ